MGNKLERMLNMLAAYDQRLEETKVEIKEIIDYRNEQGVKFGIAAVHVFLVEDICRWLVGSGYTVLEVTGREGQEIKKICVEWE